MKLHQLRALAAVSETGSMQEASRLLHVTQPALSKAIKELEASVGAALFVRTNKGVQLTPYGQRLVGHARLISENVRRARQDLEDMKGTVVSEITVAVTPVTALLRPAGACITAFRRDFPSAQLRVQEMRPAQMLEHLREGTIDFALTSQSLANAHGLDCAQACHVPTLIAGRKDHPLRNTRSLGALLEAEWLVLDPLSDTGTPFHQLFDINGMTLPSRVVECTSMTLALEMCRQSDLLVLLSEESRRSRYLVETMDFIDVDETMPDRTIALVSRDRHTLTWAAARLHDALLDALRQEFPAAD